MSKIYYDHLIVLGEVEIELKQLGLEPVERIEIENLIEETIHHRVAERILRYLPQEYHEEYLDKLHAKPYDQSLIRYLDRKIEDSVERHISDEIDKLKKEILEDLKASKN